MLISVNNLFLQFAAFPIRKGEKQPQFLYHFTSKLTLWLMAILFPARIIQEFIFNKGSIYLLVKKLQIVPHKPADHSLKI